MYHSYQKHVKHLLFPCPLFTSTCKSNGKFSFHRNCNTDFVQCPHRYNHAPSRQIIHPPLYILGDPVWRFTTDYVYIAFFTILHWPLPPVPTYKCNTSSCWQLKIPVWHQLMTIGEENTNAQLSLRPPKTWIHWTIEVMRP